MVYTPKNYVSFRFYVFDQKILYKNLSIVLLLFAGEVLTSVCQLNRVCLDSFTLETFKAFFEQNSSRRKKYL